jgi:hypothetical protein
LRVLPRDAGLFYSDRTLDNDYNRRAGSPSYWEHGRRARRHQILLLFAFTFENPYSLSQVGGCAGGCNPGDLGGDQEPREDRQGSIMIQCEQLIICAAAAIAMIYLIGPSAVWWITKAVGEWLTVILVLIWAL